MKSYVYHRSTKVCILKNKANINMKAALPSAPLGLMQFETDITNLSLQVSCIGIQDDQHYSHTPAYAYITESLMNGHKQCLPSGVKL